MKRQALDEYPYAYPPPNAVKFVQQQLGGVDRLTIAWTVSPEVCIIFDIPNHTHGASKLHNLLGCKLRYTARDLYNSHLLIPVDDCVRWIALDRRNLSTRYIQLSRKLPLTIGLS